MSGRNTRWREAGDRLADRFWPLYFSTNPLPRMNLPKSARSGTLQRLHVSEFGKICAQYPKKAREIVTGAFPAVGKNPKK